MLLLLLLLLLFLRWHVIRPGMQARRGQPIHARQVRMQGSQPNEVLQVHRGYGASSRHRQAEVGPRLCAPPDVPTSSALGRANCTPHCSESSGTYHAPACGRQLKMPQASCIYPFAKVRRTSRSLVRRAVGGMGVSAERSDRSSQAALHAASARSGRGPLATAHAQGSGSQYASMQQRACKMAAA